MQGTSTSVCFLVLITNKNIYLAALERHFTTLSTYTVYVRHRPAAPWAVEDTARTVSSPTPAPTDASNTAPTDATTHGSRIVGPGGIRVELCEFYHYIRAYERQWKVELHRALVTRDLPTNGYTRIAPFSWIGERYVE